MGIFGLSASLAYDHSEVLQRLCAMVVKVIWLGVVVMRSYITPHYEHWEHDQVAIWRQREREG